MKILARIGILILVMTHFVLAQSGKISGTVKDSKTGMALKEVIVKIESSDYSAKTNSSGRFNISDIPAGNYYLLFLRGGYYSLVIPDVEVKAGEASKLEVDMFSGDEKEFLFLEIGGIQVTANRELLSEEPETVHRISAGEIEHMQANSLADVLDMIPGNEKTGNLGLAQQQKITLRTFDNSGDDQAALFGTKVVVDDVPMTNNANLQTGAGVNYGSSVQSTAGSQYDLREIVAENIEKVEVMAGASSVEYGDHSQGVILVKTRTRNVPTRLKLKSNPDTREANLMGGFNHFNTDFVYNFNYGYSERDIRITGDEYHRISGNLKGVNRFWNERLRFSQAIGYKRKIEEDNDDSDPYGTRAYNRDHNITYSQIFDFQKNDVSQLYLRNYIDYRRRNSWRRKRESTDLGIWTDQFEEGTIVGIVGEPSYFSDVRTIGDEWSYGSKIKWTRKAFTGNILHRVLAGAEFQNDFNTGQGKSYDILKPPGGKSSTRPRSFNDVPGTLQLAIFAEDRVTGTFVFPFTMDLGFRIDSYNPTSIKLQNLFKDKDVFAADQGTFFNPRFGLKVKLTEKTQARFTFSKSSKAPALSMIYPEPYYQDVYDFWPTQVENAADGSLMDTTITLVSTSMYERTAKKLKGYQSTKYEMGLEQQVGDVGFGFVGYTQRSDGLPYAENIPTTYAIYDWPNWPDGTGKEVKEVVTIAPSKYDIARNLKWTESSGLEFSMQTHRIKSLNMRFRVNAAFNFKRYGSNSKQDYSSSTRKYTEGDTLSSGWIVPEDMQVIPYYKAFEKWRYRTVVNYSVDYIAKPLGIWLTFKAQQVLWDRNIDKDNPQEQALGYYSDGQNIAIDAATSFQMGLNRTFDPLDIIVDKSKPNDKWLFSIIASKSVFKGAEVSLFVENILNDRAYYLTDRGTFLPRNPEIFWGIAFSSKLDDIFK